MNVPPEVNVFTIGAPADWLEVVEDARRADHWVPKYPEDMAEQYAWLHTLRRCTACGVEFTYRASLGARSCSVPYHTGQGTVVTLQSEHSHTSGSVAVRTRMRVPMAVLYFLENSIPYEHVSHVEYVRADAVPGYVPPPAPRGDIHEQYHPLFSSFILRTYVPSK